mgnify:CR=1 FL=1
MHFAADKGAVMVLRIWISAAGIAATSLISAFAGLFTPWLLILSALTGMATVFAAWYPRRYVDVMHGDFDGVAVKAVTGVFQRKQLFVPMTALRTFELRSTPVQRLFGCSTVILRFAGGAAFLNLIPAKQAEELIAVLEKYED